MSSHDGHDGGDGLSPQARALVDAGRGLYVPTSADTARVHARLAAAIALPACAAAGSTAVAAAAAAKTSAGASAAGAFFGGAGALKIVGVALLVASVGGTALVVATRRRAHDAPARAIAAAQPASRGDEPAARPSPAPSVVHALPTPAPSAPPAARAPAATRSARVLAASQDSSRVAPRAPSRATPAASVRVGAVATVAPAPLETPVLAVTAAPPGPTQLEPIAPAGPPTFSRAPGRPHADEQQLVHGARAAMALGQPARALALLDEHAARFPHGALRHARRADRVLVLCMLGRVEDARAQAEVLLRRAPPGPYADIVRGSCAAPR